mmetsp:Transcript_17000/g.58559  ORF Transcript_17000/g.58559 Transcript_17000/m.58559 type:complete len:201 (+) Transcript_17000:958-1560(+)
MPLAYDDCFFNQVTESLSSMKRRSMRRRRALRFEYSDLACCRRALCDSISPGIDGGTRVETPATVPPELLASSANSFAFIAAEASFAAALSDLPFLRRLSISASSSSALSISGSSVVISCLDASTRSATFFRRASIREARVRARRNASLSSRQSPRPSLQSARSEKAPGQFAGVWSVPATLPNTPRISYLYRVAARRPLK